MEDQSAPASAGAPAEAGAASSHIAVKRRFITWDAAGNPQVVSEDVLTKAAINDLYMAAAAQMYEPDPHVPSDVQYAGLTCAEVMVRKQIQQAARTGLAETVMDRLVGRPKQSTEVTKLNLTYEDTLREIARKEQLKLGPPAARAVIIAAEIVDPILSQL